MYYIGAEFDLPTLGINKDTLQKVRDIFIETPCIIQDGRQVILI